MCVCSRSRVVDVLFYLSIGPSTTTLLYKWVCLYFNWVDKKCGCAKYNYNGLAEMTRLYMGLV